jgi:hypothetical protein
MLQDVRRVKHISGKDTCNRRVLSSHLEAVHLLAQPRHPPGIDDVTVGPHITLPPQSPCHTEAELLHVVQQQGVRAGPNLQGTAATSKQCALAHRVRVQCPA